MTFSSLVVRNLRRQPLETGLTTIAVAFGLLTFVLLRTACTAWTANVDEALSDRVVTWNKVTFQLPLPVAYVDRARRATGAETTFGSWFGGHDAAHPRDSMSTFAVDDNYFRVHDNLLVPGEQLRAWRDDRQGAIVGDALAAKLGYAIGDRIVLESSAYPGAREVRVSGVFRTRDRTVDRGQLLFHWRYLNDEAPDGQRDQVGWMMSRAGARGSADLARTIDREFENDPSQTLSMSEQSMRLLILSNYSALLSSMNVVCVILLAIVAVIVGNAIAIRVRTRTHEYGVLGALGFGAGHIVTLVIGEAAGMAAIGGALGLALSHLVIDRGIGPMVERSVASLFPSFRAPASAMAVGLALVVAAAAAAAALPALQASRLRSVDALRRVD